MGDLGLDTAGRATGISSSLDDIFLQKLQEARFNEVQRQAQAEMDMRRQQMDQQAQAQQFNEKIRQDTLAENARQHSAAEADKAGQLADKRFALTPIGGLVPMADYQKMQGAGIPSQLFKPQPLTAAAPPSSIATGGPETLPGTFANSVEPDAQNHIRQATQPEIEQQSKDDAAAAKEADALKFRDAQAAETMRHNKAQEAAASAAASAKGDKADKPITLSAAGKAAKTAIEQAGPMTDQVLEMIRQQAPDIEKNPQKYNTLGAKAGSLVQVAKYKMGIYDETDPRQQLVSLLQPIQAGQYMRNSRSRQMLAIALKHMADPSQTLLTQYQRAKELKSIMPEMLEGIVRGEQPVDAKNPLAGTYFDPNKPMPSHETAPKQYLDDQGNPK